MNLFKKIVALVTGKSSPAPSTGKPSANRSQNKRKAPYSKGGQVRNQAPNKASAKATQPSKNAQQAKRNTGAPNQTSETQRPRPGKSDRPRNNNSFDPSRPAKGRGENTPQNRERSDRPRRGGRMASSGMRPGGAKTEEQVQASQLAHAQWDPATYQVAPEEGKVTFADMNLPSELLHAVSDLGFEYCTPIQAQSLEHALAGRNVAGRAQTGTGKTAAFLIAMLTRYLKSPEKRNLPGCPRALILAPTRELVIQICKDAETLGKYCGQVRSLAVYGGMDYDLQREELVDAPVDLLVATPGRLLDFVRQRVVDLRQVDTLVIDEADRMLDMGFIPDVRAIVNRMPAKEARCTMLYSATLDETVMRLASMWMQEPVKIEIEGEAVTTENIRQVVYIVRAEEKFKLLYNHLYRYADARTIIFCNRKSTTEHVADSLRRLGISCETLSGDVAQNKRLRVLDDFREGRIRTVVATDVAGRGIHVDDIAFVVNYDFPYEPEDYVHRIGRTGRAGATGTAISFADEDESFTIPDIEAYIKEPLKCVQPEEWLLADLPERQPRGGRRERYPARSDVAPITSPVEIAEEAPVATPVEAPAKQAPPPPPAGTPVAAKSEVVLTTQADANGVMRTFIKTVVVESETPVEDVTPVKITESVSLVDSAETIATTVATISVEPVVPVLIPTEDIAPVELATPVAMPVESIEPDQSTVRPASPAKLPPNRTIRRPIERKFKPRGSEQARDESTVRDRPPRPPRKERPMARKVNNHPQSPRTQAHGPRDGSESHHATAIAARPIFPSQMNGRQEVEDSWTPGES